MKRAGTEQRTDRRPHHVADELMSVIDVAGTSCLFLTLQRSIAGCRKGVETSDVVAFVLLGFIQKFNARVDKTASP